jgi:spore protease
MNKTEKKWRWGAEIPRTDLACEGGTVAAEEETRTVEIGDSPVTVTRRRETDGGRSVTLSFGRITARGERELTEMAETVADEMVAMAEAMTGRRIGGDLRVLVVGLGNRDMTPDAIGPGTVSRITVTRHLKAYDEALFGGLGCCELSALSPGVMGQTGMESGELVAAAVGLTTPHLVVAVDALAARSVERLSSTVQLSDGGIAPGAGIGNHRMPLTKESLGCPVLGVGVPTVVDSSTLVWDALMQGGMGEDDLPPELQRVLTEGRSFIVSPRDCDRMVELTCRMLAMALDMAFGVGEV